MQFIQSVESLITSRKSCRSYQNPPLTENEKMELTSCFHAFAAAPFGSIIKIELLIVDFSHKNDFKEMGTYGMFHDARAFVIGKVSKNEKPMQLEDFGYQLQQVVLKATDMNLGTCWASLSFNPTQFDQLAHCKEDEKIPSILFIGQPSKSIVLKTG